MGRRKILDLDVFKFSLNVSGENKKILDSLTRNYSLKYGPMINMIIQIVCRMPKNVKNTIEKACLEEYKRLTKEINQTAENSYHRGSLEQERGYYIDILNLINQGSFSFPDDDDEKIKMKKIKMRDGYLIIPDDWIIVNSDQADNVRYAAVLECQNHMKYGVPHFVYFTDHKHVREYDAHMESDFLHRCERIWPDFTKIRELSDQNQLIRDPENPKEFLNEKEHLAAPIIAFFHIPELGDKYYFPDPPYGAMIVRSDCTNNVDE